MKQNEDRARAIIREFVTAITGVLNAQSEIIREKDEEIAKLNGYLDKWSVHKYQEEIARFKKVIEYASIAHNTMMIERLREMARQALTKTMPEEKP